MDYTRLAIQLIDMRASVPQIKMERTMSQIARGEVLALNYLAANGNRAYPKEISRALMLTTARVAAMLKSMEGQGMVTRVPDPADSRQVIVSLTEKGAALVEELTRQGIAALSGFDAPDFHIWLAQSLAQRTK